MRLLHSKTLQFHEFVGSHIPPYAILSHRWEEEEVIFADMQKRDCEGKAGYDKIKKCCAQAITDNLEYIWVDTCCIDKSSSAELSEAINSMFQWYKNAAVCYAYLSDVNPNLDQNSRSAGGTMDGQQFLCQDASFGKPVVHSGLDTSRTTCACFCYLLCQRRIHVRLGSNWKQGLAVTPYSGMHWYRRSCTSWPERAKLQCRNEDVLGCTTTNNAGRGQSILPAWIIQGQHAAALRRR